jgi:lipid-binding SYLF domain-containing protein
MRAIVTAIVMVLAAAAPPARADSAAEIDRKVQATLREFRQNTPPKVQRYVDGAKGVLVFPAVVKAGIGIGGEYGEGALLVGGRNAGYYSVAGASIGFQLGAQSRAQLILFMTPKALADFRKSKGWKAGVDGSIALVTLGAGGEVLTPDADDQPVLGFVYGAKGLMYNLSFEGQKFSRIQP